MATIKVEPIQTHTRAGYPATITGISPTNHDCIVGEVTLPSIGLKRQVWDLNGTARDSVDGCNLDMNEDELAEVADLAKHLGTRGNA